MLTTVLAVELQPEDQINDHGVTLTVASAVETDWTNGDGRKHYGVEVITRQRGPRYPVHYALAETVQVRRP